MTAPRVAVIIGGAEGGWEERDEALGLARAHGFDVVSIAVNDAMAEHPDPLHHAISLHPQKFETWERKRVAAGLGGGYVKWSMPGMRRRTGAGLTHKVPHGADRIIEYRWRDASSGISAVELALRQLDVPAILCGVPLDPRPHRYKGRPWGAAKRYLRGYQRARAEFGGRVRSMSGRTRADLGFPDAEWFAYLAETAVSQISTEVTA